MIKQLIINNKKSYDDFGVYIASRNITSPKKKVIKESIPFSNVVYDFSKINGELYWEERTLQYSFDIAEITTEQMEEVKSNLLNWLLNVHDADIYDPYIGDYHFHGSYNSDSWIEDFGAGTITVSFSVYPYKISNGNSNIIEEIGVSDGLIEGNYSVVGLKIDGKSIQDGTPAPSSPVEIESVEINGIKVNGKNLFNIASALENQKVGTADNKAYIAYDNGVQTNQNAYNNGRTYMLLKLKTGTYTISANVMCSNSNWNFSIKNYDNNEIIFNQNYSIDSKVIQTLTISNDGLIGFCFMCMDENGPTTTTTNIQLELGSVATTYEVYKEQIVECESMILRSINEVKDIYKNGKITRNIGVVDLSTLSWIYENGWFQTTIDNIKYVNSNTEIGNALCNRYKIRTGSGFSLAEVGEFAIDVNNIKFKTGSSISPTGILYYELETPIIERVEQPTITSYSPITNITIDSDLQTTFEVYYNDTKTIKINNNSSHRIAPTITSTGSFNIKLNDVSYSVGEGTYNNTFYLEAGENKLTLTGYGEITFSYAEEMF